MTFYKSIHQHLEMLLFVIHRSIFPLKLYYSYVICTSWAVLYTPLKSFSLGTLPFYGKVLPPLLWTHSWATHGKITVSGTPNCLNYYVIFILCT